VTVVSTLPLAFVMIAGPQIISSFFFATSEKWKSDSAAWILGAAIGSVAVVTIAYFAAKGIKSSLGHGDSKSRTIDYVLIALLLILMVHTYLKRNQSEPPKWMGKLQTASPRFIFTLGLLLMSVFPSDLITLVVVGTHLANEGHPWWHALPFIALALLLLALPALAVLALGERAENILPKIRNWMDTNSWIVSEIVLVFFIVIVAHG
jgi:Sap, sulfolipid-1-addressing protein